MKTSESSKSYRDLCKAFDSLPGIGEQSAQRLVEWLVYHGDLDAFAESLSAIQTQEVCRSCNRLMALDECHCIALENPQSSLFLVVESEAELQRAFDAGYQGRFYVLHGVLSPARGIGPEQLKISNLIETLTSLSATTLTAAVPTSQVGVVELLLPLADSVEGRATAEFIQRKSGIEGSVLTMKELIADLPKHIPQRFKGIQG